MTIKYEPKKLLARMAPKKKIKELVSTRLTVKKAALNAISDTGILGKEVLEDIALKVLKDYRERVKEFSEQGLSKKAAREEIGTDLLVQRVQNATVNEITERIKDQFHGEYYVWLPSTADVPDEKHMRKYGKKYQIGKGEAPGDRYGCKCGMEILVNQSRLRLK